MNALQEKALALSSHGYGLYVHVPFCASTCDFCAFYQEAPERAAVERYLEGIQREVALRQPPRRARTVFIGGGTPGVLTARDFQQLGSTLQPLIDPDGFAEWTVEMAPSTVKTDKLRALRDSGVTRISLGVQSFNERFLEALGRRQSAKQARAAYDLIRAEGFQSVNLDLIFAIPGQDRPELEADLEAAVALEPDHISTYCLTFEEDTALYVRLSEGRLAIDETREADLYARTWDFLEARGYAQYEVSNFAKPGHLCQHNLITWQMGDWLGLGPAAASQWTNQRFMNVPDLQRWGQGLSEEKLEVVEAYELTESLLLADRLIFGLRTVEGVHLEALRTRFGDSAVQAVLNWPIWARWRAAGWLEAEASCLRLTRQGRLLADRLGVEILEAQENQDAPQVIC
ncbi:MAG: radical SAM family heme chaperone HemW [Opitutales bacterium]